MVPRRAGESDFGIVDDVTIGAGGIMLLALLFDVV